MTENLFIMSLFAAHFAIANRIGRDGKESICLHYLYSENGNTKSRTPKKANLSF